MNEKPEALRLAELLDEAMTVLDEPFHHNSIAENCDKAAAELRRLHEENERLREAVAAEREACAKACDARKIIEPDYEDERHYNQGIEHCVATIRAMNEQEQPR